MPAPLSDQAIRLFDVCAQVMSQRDQGGVDLSLLTSELQRHREDGYQAITSYLANRVEQRSGGQLTVRAVDDTLVLDQIFSGLYVAVCSGDTPPHPVEELNPNLTLYVVGSYRDGLRRSEPAAEADVIARRASRAKLQQQIRDEATGRDTVVQLLDRLFEQARARIAQTADDDTRQRAEYVLRNGRPSFNLESAATICTILELSFADAVQAAL